MIPRRSAKSIPDLVSRYVVICAQQEALEKERCDLRDILVQKGKGALRGANGETIQVIYPDPKIQVQADKIELIKERIGEENFKTLIERVVTWKPVKSCRDVANRVLTKLQLRQFLGLTESECAPYIRIS